MTIEKRSRKKNRIVVPKTVEEQLRKLIDDVNDALDDPSTPGALRFQSKGGPIRALWRDGLLTFDNIMNELELIAHKRSKLTRDMRDAVVMFVNTASMLFQASLEKNKDEIKTQDVQETVNEKKDGEVLLPGVQEDAAGERETAEDLHVND